jgi:hypothetical protein
MHSLITDYALEGKTDGEPNHHFYLTKDAVHSVAKNVISQHLGFEGEKRDNYVNQKLAKLYPHFDVNNEGFLDAARVPPLLKLLIGD